MKTEKKTWRPLRPKVSQRPQYQTSGRQQFARENKIKKSKQLRVNVRLQYYFYRLLSYLGVLLLVLGSLYGLLTRYLLVRQIHCQLYQNLPCPENLEKQSQTLLGQALLFHNFESELESWRTPELNFVKVTYHKVFPETLILNFYFNSPLYQLTTDGKNWFNFDQFGHYTIAPPSEDLMQVWLVPPELQNSLNTYTLDPVLSQKLFDLAYLSTDKRDAWLKITVHDLRTLQIDTTQASYYLDFFALDENLQKLEFVENSDWQPPDTDPIVDLRLNWPVVKQD